MESFEWIQAISAKDVDLDKFVQISFTDDEARAEIVHQMLTHPHIGVYYPCYTVVSKASQASPELFYPYWGDMVPLLQHKNSYHRDMALTILANLTQADRENLFPLIFHDYFVHVDDPKFMTGKCCVQNSIKIIRSKPELKDQILALLIDVEHHCAYPAKQKELLKSDVLEILDEVYAEVSDKPGVDGFIRTCAASISPKTRYKAKKLAGEFGL
jgi:hypothetical protein